MSNEMTEAESRELLRTHKLGRPGCCAAGAPYVIPIHHLYADDGLYVRSLPGHKSEPMRGNPQVCLQVDEIQDAYNWRSVIAFGGYEELTDRAEREARVAFLFKQLPHLAPVESMVTKGLPEATAFRIRIERITGARETWQH